MYVSDLDLFDLLKVKFGEAEAKILVKRFAQTEAVVVAKIEKAEAIAEIKFDKAMEKQAKIHKDDIIGLKEFMEEKFKGMDEKFKAMDYKFQALEAKMDDKFASKADLANVRADTIKWSFIFLVTEMTILGSLLVGLFFKQK